MSGSRDQQFKLIKEDKLKDKKLTAENLRGKKIVDQDGQVIGKVKDIGLGSAMQDDGRGSNQPYASSSSSSVGAGAPTGRSSNQSEQLTLYVELDDKVEIEGDDLAAIPASRVRFDSDKEELKLQIKRSELTSQLKQRGTSSDK